MESGVAAVVVSPDLEGKEARGKETLRAPAAPAGDSGVEVLGKGEVYYVCVERWLNVRNAPEWYADVVSVYTDGQYVTVYEWDKTWARVGARKWVNGKYLCR